MSCHDPSRQKRRVYVKAAIKAKRMSRWSRFDDSPSFSIEQQAGAGFACLSRLIKNPIDFLRVVGMGTTYKLQAFYAPVAVCTQVEERIPMFNN
jgi:hypothetical protein